MTVSSETILFGMGAVVGIMGFTMMWMYNRLELLIKHAIDLINLLFDEEDEEPKKSPFLTAQEVGFTLAEDDEVEIPFGGKRG